MQNDFPATPSVPENNAISRRAFIRFSVITGIASAGIFARDNALATTEQRTPRETEGPFYPLHQQQDKDTDLTLIETHTASAKGEVIIVSGTVFDTQGRIIEGAFIDIWQANTWGRYRHARDPNPAPLDPDFQGWGQTHTDAQGNYRFKTILPGSYPAGPGWTRPPHIHFKISRSGYTSLTTQMYFPGQALNEVDLILQQHSAAEQKQLIASRDNANTDAIPVFRFDIYLPSSV